MGKASDSESCQSYPFGQLFGTKNNLEKRDISMLDEPIHEFYMSQADNVAKSL